MNRMSRCALPALLAVSVLGGVAAAQDSAAGAAPALTALSPAVAVGPAVRSWMALQRSGAQASTVERALPGEIAERSYQRYAKSFEQPIPETFEREQFGQRGGSR